MKFLYLIATILLISTLTTPAWSEPDSKNMSALELRDMCASKSDIDYGFCAGYISAIARIMSDHRIGKYEACNHDQVRSQQLIDTYMTWSDIFRDKLSMPAESAVAASLARAFPCR